MAFSAHECLLPTLSFQGHTFADLPGEVVKEVRQQNSLPFLARVIHSAPSFALYADPAFWRYGLLLFCSNMRTSKMLQAEAAASLVAGSEEGPENTPDTPQQRTNVDCHHVLCPRPCPWQTRLTSQQRHLSIFLFKQCKA